jgi:NAD(P)-dependent dehydrogenase (short-subunit alcohol dehydrogenase family)
MGRSRIRASHRRPGVIAFAGRIAPVTDASPKPNDPPSPSSTRPDLRGRTALVTGGGTGIGKGCARALAAAGARVTICGPDADVLASACAEILASSPAGTVGHVTCDVTDETLVSAAVAAAAGDGNLDIAVANAGTGFPGSLLHLERDHWMVPLGVNVLGTAFTIKHAAARMKQHGGGSIVTMSSVASTRPTSFMAAYSVSKAAVDELTRLAAQELGRFGIRVNGIRPGWIQTESVMRGALPASLEQAHRETALGRLGEPADIARAVLYLASDQSEWVTGQLLAVCGGFSLVPPSYDVAHLARMVFPDAMARDFG